MELVMPHPRWNEVYRKKDVWTFRVAGNATLMQHAKGSCFTRSGCKLQT